MKTIALLSIITMFLTGCPEEGAQTGSQSATSVEDIETTADEVVVTEDENATTEEKVAEVDKADEANKTDKAEETGTTTTTTTTTTTETTSTAPAKTNAALSLDKTSHAYGSKNLGTTTTQSITLTNSGDIKASSMTYSGLEAPFTVDSSGCGAELAGKDTCIIKVTYQPSASGDHADVLTISYDSGAANLTGSSATLNLSGKGLTRPSLVLSATTHAFGAKNIGTTTTKKITLTNAGETKAKSITYSGLTTPFTVSGCSAEIAGGSTSCDLTFTYTPTNTGNHSSTLTVSYSDGAATQSTTITLTGSVTPSILNVSPTSGIQGQSLTVNGNNFTSTTTIKIGNADCSNISGQTATQLTCTIPANAAGVHGITLNDSTKTASYTGYTQLSLASITADVSSSDFGDVKIDVASAKTYTLTNNGGYQASSLSFSGLAAPYVKTGGTCGSTLAAGASCTAIVTFTPTTITDNQTDELKFDYNNGLEAATQGNINLSGNGKDRIVDVEAGTSTSFAMYKSGKVKSVGSGYSGKSGNGNTTNQNYNTWQDVSGLTDAKAISAGANATCVIHTDDNVSCWGGVYYPTVATIYHSPESTGESGTKVSVGGNLIAILKADGSGRTYGRGTEGQLANDTFSSANGGNFEDVDGSGTGGIVITQFAAGSLHLVALANDGKVYSAGANSSKQIGTTHTNAKYKTLTLINGLSNIVAVGAGASYSAALDNSGRVWVWGEGSYGTKGDNTTTDTETPVLAFNDNAAKMSVGNRHICVIKTDKSVRCWGNANYGQLGNNNDNSLWNQTPQDPGLSNVLDIDCGGFHTIAVTEDGRVFTFGNNGAGELGLGDKVKRLVPTEVTSGL